MTNDDTRPERSLPQVAAAAAAAACPAAPTIVAAAAEAAEAAADSSKLRRVELSDLISHLQQAVDIGFREVRTDVALVRNELGLLKGRVDINESRITAGEERVGRLSSGAKELRGQTSNADLEQDARIASTITAHAELNAKVDALSASQELQLAILGRLDKITSSPQIKIVLAILTTALMSWAASKGLNAK